MIERAGGNGTTPETHPELYAFPGPRESSGLREELARMSMQVVDLKIEADKLRLTLERVRVLLADWRFGAELFERSLGLPDKAAKRMIKELQAALEGDQP